MIQNAEPCALLNAASRCTALKQKHRECPTVDCPFYVTAEQRAKSEALAHERCERMGILYRGAYERAAKGEL